MRIKLNELRRIVRTILKEEMSGDRPTISADLDPDEKNLKAKHPNWGYGKQKMGVDSPAKVKSKQVEKILAAQGVTSDPHNKKMVVHELLPFIEKMDPQDALLADPEEIAAEFSSQILGMHAN